MRPSSALTVSLVVVCVVLALIPSGSALKCYKCDLGNDCDDEFDEKKGETVTCDLTNVPPRYLDSVRKDEKLEFQCGKITVSGTDATGTKTEGIRRSCVPKVKNVCDVISGMYEIETLKKGKVDSCHVCDKDKCNGAGAITASLVTLFMAIAAAFYMH